MGLEKHVNRVIEEADSDLLNHCYWLKGDLVVNANASKRIMRILDASDEFGPTRNNGLGRIEFGSYHQFYPDESFLNSAEYWDRFKAGLVD